MLLGVALKAAAWCGGWRLDEVRGGGEGCCALAVVLTWAAWCGGRWPDELRGVDDGYYEVV